jgi:prepilin-type N-terminal cleavage/methylation domain-containing protein
MRQGFTFIEVVVTLGVLAAVLLVVNQVVVSAVRQVEISKNNYYVDVILSEGYEQVNFVHQANLLRYGRNNFDECKLTRVDEALGVDCDGLSKYEGRYLVVVQTSNDRQVWDLVRVQNGKNLVDNVDDPTLFEPGFEDFEVYEKSLSGGGVVYTNVENIATLKDDYKPLGYYRYVDIASDGDFQVVVAYMDEYSNLKVRNPDYLIGIDD